MSRSSMQSRKLVISLILCSFGALTVRAAPAGICPPGSHGAAAHCQPIQAKPRPTNAMRGHASAFVTPSVDRSHAGQVQPATEPATHRTGAAQTHGIIFVGGKSAINSQPVPPGHSPDKVSINSQPVPPGRAVHQTPRPGAPVEHAHKPRVEQADRSHR